MLKPLITITFAMFLATLVPSTAMRYFVDERNTPIGVGEEAPDFTLEDQHHNQIKLSAARGKSPVVLVFYRGYW